MSLIFIETPALDEIGISQWFNTKYNVKQQEEIQELIDNHVWVTSRKIQIPVKTMDTKHIKNCINCWNGKGKMRIPSGYLGGKMKWLKIFEEELLNRQ